MNLLTPVIAPSAVAMVFAVAFLVLASTGVFASGEIVKVSPFMGRWVVDEVRINMWEGRTRYYQLDDEALKWRIVNVSENSLKSNIPEIYSACEPLSIEYNKMRALDLMKGDFYNGKEGAHFSQYDLSIEGSAPIGKIEDSAELDVFRFKCGNEYLSLGTDYEAFEGAWFITLDKDKLAMRWHDNTILILKKIPEGKNLSPSFNCNNKLNVAEKTICNSDELSGYDLSIASLYKTALKWYSDYSEEDRETQKRRYDTVRKQQNSWISQRNKCKDDVACMEKIMAKRLEELREQKKDPDFGGDFYMTR